MNPGWLPAPLRHYVLDFEARISDAVSTFSAALPPGAQILDAGAGEGQYRNAFIKHRYTGIDLAVGDTRWDYSRLDVLGDLERLPFRDSCFDAAVNIVTLEHVRRPEAVLSEIARVLRQKGRLLLAVPHEWEVHQHPNDYFRYTAFGVAHLADAAGFAVVSIAPAGGYFRLLARRLLNGAQFFPAPLALLWLLAVAPAALVLPLLDGLDRRADFTLGYIAVLENRRE